MLRCVPLRRSYSAIATQLKATSICRQLTTSSHPIQTPISNDNPNSLPRIKTSAHEEHQLVSEDAARLGSIYDTIAYTKQPNLRRKEGHDSSPKHKGFDNNEEGQSVNTCLVDDVLRMDPDLPLSPYMIPEYFNPSRMHVSKKAPPSKNPTPFQVKLSRNIYAQALATPIRLCAATSISLPNFFLQDLNLMAHPETGEPWWVPGQYCSSVKKGPANEGISSHEKPISESECHSNSVHNGGSGVEEPFATDSIPTPVTQSPVQSVSSGKVYPNPKLGPRVWLSSRQEVFSAFQDPMSGYGTQPWHGIVPSMLTGSTTRAISTNSSWRADLDQYLLERMRCLSRESLEYLCTLKRGYLTSCTTLVEASARKKQPVAILWTGFPGPEILEHGETTQRHSPHEFATLDLKQPNHILSGASRSKIPVHNLHTLLGKEHLQYLRDKYPAFKTEFVVLKDRNVTTPATTILWRLQGYLAHYEEFFMVGEAGRLHKARQQRRMSIKPGAFRNTQGNRTQRHLNLKPKSIRGEEAVGSEDF